MEAAGARAGRSIDAAVNNETGLARLLASLNGVMLPGATRTHPRAHRCARRRSIVRASIDAHSRGNTDEKSSGRRGGGSGRGQQRRRRRRKRRGRGGAGWLLSQTGQERSRGRGGRGRKDGELGSDVKRQRTAAATITSRCGDVHGFQLLRRRWRGRSLLGVRRRRLRLRPRPHPVVIHEPNAQIAPAESSRRRHRPGRDPRVRESRAGLSSGGVYDRR